MQRNRIEDQFHKIGARVLEILGRQTWLDRPSYRLENVLSFFYNAFGRHRDRVTNVLNGVWLGHPVHPPLASLASGAIGTAVALDAVSLLPSKSAEQPNNAHRFAQRAVAFGVMANLAAAVTGVTDWQHTHDRERRIGLVHGLVNTIATAVYIRSWRHRRNGRHLRGMLTTALGYGLTAGGSYLGGALVFGSGIGIDQSGKQLRTAEWTPVLPVAELHEGQLRRAEVDGTACVLHRSGDGRVTAFGEYCPHLAAPMADGWVDRDRIVCPWHGSRFAIESGQVLRGPSAAPLPRYPARIRAGMVEVRGDTTGTPTAGEGVHK